jgi:hypothetical protein
MEAQWSEGSPGGASLGHSGAHQVAEASASGAAHDHSELSRTTAGIQQALDRAVETVRNDPDLSWTEKRS